MVLGQLLTALTPWAPYLLLLVLFGTVYYELRGAMGRAGTTARRSAWGVALFLALVGALGVGLILTGWSTFGAVTLLFVVAVVVIWVATASSHRRG